MNKEQVSNAYVAEELRRSAVWPLPMERRVLITGAGKSGSIGEAIANRLRTVNNKVLHFQGDVRDDVDERELREFDTLICCHGVTWLDWLENAPIERVREIIDVNLTGSILLARAFVRATYAMRFHKQMFFIGSMAHRAVLNGSAAYCASKAGLQHFVRCAAWELAPKGYDVFCINPSNTEGTPMTEDTIRGLMRYRGLTREAADSYWGAVCPKGKWLQPQDIARTVQWLFEGNGEFLSGTAIDLPGGAR